VISLDIRGLGGKAVITQHRVSESLTLSAIASSIRLLERKSRRDIALDKAE